MNLAYQNNLNAEQPQETLSMHPKKFILWLLIVSIIMMFAGLTSAYIVRQGDGNWLEFELPNAMWISTVVLFLSSVTMQWAHYAAKKDSITTMRIAIVLTALLGVGFIYGQMHVWDVLKSMKVVFEGNPAGSFLYVLTGLHVFHLVTGIIFVFIVLINAFRYKIHSKRMAQIDMCATYWHFLDALWVYLFVFLIMNH